MKEGWSQEHCWLAEPLTDSTLQQGLVEVALGEREREQHRRKHIKHLMAATSSQIPNTFSIHFCSVSTSIPLIPYHWIIYRISMLTYSILCIEYIASTHRRHHLCTGIFQFCQKYVMVSEFLQEREKSPSHVKWCILQWYMLLIFYLCTSQMITSPS